MSLAETLDSSAAAAPLSFDQRRRVTGPGSAAAAVDAEERRAAIDEAVRAEIERLRLESEAAERAEAARLAAIEVELQLEAERLALLRDDEDDRRAFAFNVVAATERQKGREVTSRKGAATADLIKRLLDALHDDDAPVAHPQFSAGALGGRSALPLATIRDLATGAAAASPSPAPREKVAAQRPDEGRAASADAPAIAIAPAA